MEQVLWCNSFKPTNNATMLYKTIRQLFGMQRNLSIWVGWVDALRLLSLSVSWEFTLEASLLSRLSAQPVSTSLACTRTVSLAAIDWQLAWHKERLVIARLSQWYFNGHTMLLQHRYNVHIPSRRRRPRIVCWCNVVLSTSKMQRWVDGEILSIIDGVWY